jgi:hypothetical protein
VSGRWLVATFAVLVALYPPRFRREYGPALLEVFEAQVRDGDLPPWRLWLMILADVAGSLVPEHLANLAGSPVPEHLANLAGAGKRELLSAIDCPDVRRGARFGIVLGLVWTVFNVLDQGLALDAQACAILSDAFLASGVLVLVAAGLAGSREGAGAETGFAAAVVGSVIGISTMWIATWVFWQNNLTDPAMIEDFRRSGMATMGAFVISDAIGASFVGAASALLLGAVLGAAGGVVGRRWRVRSS